MKLVYGEIERVVAESTGRPQDAGTPADLDVLCVTIRLTKGPTACIGRLVMVETLVSDLVARLPPTLAQRLLVELQHRLG